VKKMVRVASVRELTTGLAGFGTGFLSGFIMDKILLEANINAMAPRTPLFALDDWIHMIVTGACLLFGKPEVGLGYLLGALTQGGWFR